jgi:hypothetical protein
MNAMPCQFEAEILRTLRSGNWSAALLDHKEHCPDCREVILVAEAMQQDAVRLQLQAEPPSVTQVWALSRRRQREEAMERATRWVRVLKLAGWLYASIFLVWGLRLLPKAASDSWLTVLNPKALDESVAAAILAAIFVASGVLYALRSDQRQTG